MKNFADLKQYIKKHDAGKYYLLRDTDKTISIQVYGSHLTQANIQINSNAVIKFEERTEDLFTVSMCENNDPTYTIKYSKCKDFPLNDNLSILINCFLNSDYISDVVGALLLN